MLIFTEQDEKKLQCRQSHHPWFGNNNLVVFSPPALSITKNLILHS